jgi:hypothetical protein
MDQFMDVLLWTMIGAFRGAVAALCMLAAGAVIVAVVLFFNEVIPQRRKYQIRRLKLLLTDGEEGGKRG